MGYHKRDIVKGQVGEFSKIREEFEELSDAYEQGDKVLMICEMTDLVGAVSLFAKKFGLTIGDLVCFSDKTMRAFEEGRR